MSLVSSPSIPSLGISMPIGSAEDKMKERRRLNKFMALAGGAGPTRCPTHSLHATGARR